MHGGTLTARSHMGNSVQLGGMEINLKLTILFLLSAVSMMSNRGDFHQIPVEDWNGRIYGLVNEGVPCKVIEVYTGQSGAICDSHPASKDTP